MADLKLILARDNINTILEGLDIAGYFVLYNAPGTFEIFSKLNASFSTLTREQPEPPVDAPSSIVTNHCDAGAQRLAFVATAGMVRGIAEALCWNGMQMMRMADALDAHLDICPDVQQQARGTEH